MAGAVVCVNLLICIFRKTIALTDVRLLDSKGKMLKIELHITINKLTNNEIESFEKFCHTINAKPILILLSTGANAQQPMISKIITCSNKHELKKEMESIKEQFKSNSYEVTRIKLEVAPWDAKEAKILFEGDTNNYYEWHGKIRIDNEKYAATLITNLGGHISRNVLKRDPNSKFITIRDYGTEEDINCKIDLLKNGLNQNNVEIIKEELEYCIFDSNVSLDNGWI